MMTGYFSLLKLEFKFCLFSGTRQWIWNNFDVSKEIQQLLFSLEMFFDYHITRLFRVCVEQKKTELGIPVVVYPYNIVSSELSHADLSVICTSPTLVWKKLWQQSINKDSHATLFLI